MPAIPSNFAADVVSKSQVRLTWDDPGTDESGYSVEYSATSSSAGFLPYGIVSDPTVALLVKDLSENTQYWFRVRSYNSGGSYSGYSSVVTATPSYLKAITHETTLPATGSWRRPLPTLGHWVNRIPPLAQDGVLWHPDAVKTEIQAGNYMVPWLSLGAVKFDDAYTAIWEAHADEIMTYAAANNLPIVLIAGNQVAFFRDVASSYYSLPEADNPLAFKSGVKQDKVDVLGPEVQWTNHGGDWGGTGIMAEYQNLYPNPPKVIILWNNEDTKITPFNVADSDRFTTAHPGYAGMSTEEIADLCWDYYVARYTAFFNGFNAQLTSAWQNVVVHEGFVGNVESNGGFGHNEGRRTYAPYYRSWSAGPDDIAGNADDEICRAHEYHNGCNQSIYNLSFKQYQRAESPQMHSQHWVEKLEYIHGIDPNFRFGLALFEGYSTDITATGINSDGATGLARVVSLLTRPVELREYRDYDQTINGDEDHNGNTNSEYWSKYKALINEIHETPELREFYGDSEVVVNTGESAPTFFYNNGAGAMRPGHVPDDNWFKLTTSVDPAGYTADETLVPVWAFARVIGTTPNRVWLVAAFATDTDRTNITITIPGYGNFNMDVPEIGAYALVSEANDVIPFTGIPTGVGVAQVGTTTSANVTWTPATAISTCTVRYSWDGNVWTEITGVTNNGSYSLDFGDYEDTTLYVSIAEEGEVVRGTFSSAATATITPQGVETPSGLAISQVASTAVVSATYTVPSDYESSSIHLEYSWDGGTSVAFTDTDTPADNSTTTVMPSYGGATLSARARFENGAGDYGDWSGWVNTSIVDWGDPTPDPDYLTALLNARGNPIYIDNTGVRECTLGPTTGTMIVGLPITYDQANDRFAVWDGGTVGLADISGIVFPSNVSSSGSEQTIEAMFDGGCDFESMKVALDAFYGVGVWSRTALINACLGLDGYPTPISLGLNLQNIPVS